MAITVISFVPSGERNGRIIAFVLVIGPKAEMKLCLTEGIGRVTSFETQSGICTKSPPDDDFSQRGCSVFRHRSN